LTGLEPIASVIRLSKKAMDNYVDRHAIWRFARFAALCLFLWSRHNLSTNKTHRLNATSKGIYTLFFLTFCQY